MMLPLKIPCMLIDWAWLSFFRFTIQWFHTQTGRQTEGREKPVKWIGESLGTQEEESEREFFLLFRRTFTFFRSHWSWVQRAMCMFRLGAQEWGQYMIYNMTSYNSRRRGGCCCFSYHIMANIESEKDKRDCQLTGSPNHSHTHT